MNGLGRAGADDGFGPVAGELTQPLARLISALLLERFGHTLVKPRAAGTPEILIERVLDKCVGEREAIGSPSAFLQQRRRNTIIEQIEQLPLGQISYSRE